MKTLMLVLFFFVNTGNLVAQVEGCTDPQAINFNPLSTKNNGSCLYAPQSYVPQNEVLLPLSIAELSGLIFWNGSFWGHNDSGNGPWFYEIDSSSGIIKKVIGLTGATNVDWEDMAQDSNNIYIGDFGNNANGNRKNLKIYVIPKSNLSGSGDTILVSADKFSIISFKYPDQTDFSPTGNNKTRFDCEALFFHRGRLHLFTKNWLGNYAVHYSLPSLAGNYTATRLDSLNTSGFLITGADIGAEDQILLTSYNASGACAMFLVYGFNTSDSYFETGNKRLINLPGVLTIGQLESVCYINGIHGALGSEKFRFSFLEYPQNITRFTTSQWVFDHYKRNTPAFAEPGMIRFNGENNSFEYFDGINWQILKTE